MGKSHDVHVALLNSNPQVIYGDYYLLAGNSLLISFGILSLYFVLFTLA
jgi:hypothetical protein